jgi:FkbM family methyltransferase
MEVKITTVNKPQWPMVHGLRYFTFRHAGNTRVQSVDNHIAETGLYQGHVLKEAAKHIKEGDVVVDAGANCGYFTCAFARLAGPTGHVHSFEPLQIIYQQLCANVFVNAFHTVSAHNVALSDTNGTAYINKGGEDFDPTDIDTFFEGCSIYFPEEGEEPIGKQVPVRTLDSYHLPKVDFMKVDIEGHEREFLMGARETIERCKPKIILEWAKGPEVGEERNKKVQRYMHKLGYKFNKVKGREVICVPR